MFTVADGTAKLSGRDNGVRESTLRRDQTVRSEDFFKKDHQGISDKSQPIDETKDDAEASNDPWSMEGDFIYRDHVEPRVQLYVPKEETFPFPLKHIDVTRATYTILDVLQGQRTDDYWSVDVNRSLSDSWKGFTKLTQLKRETSKGMSVFPGAAYKNSSNYQT